MQHPYRFALASRNAPTCLDPPIRACRAPEPPRRVEMALALALGVVAATGLYAERAIGHGGHVEIAPGAVALARPHAPAHAHAHARARTPPPARTAPAPPAQHALLKGLHAPKELVARARKLEALGADVAVMEVSIPSLFASWPGDDQLWPSSYQPVYGLGRRLEGLAVHGVPAESPLRVAGIADGDVVLGIDGYDFGDLSLREIDAAAVRARGWLVVEIARAEHHVVLSIRWPVAHKR
jgi:hypothetical protein